MLLYASAFDLYDAAGLPATLLAAEPADWEADDHAACSIVEDGAHSSRALRVADDDGYAAILCALDASTETLIVHAWVKVPVLYDGVLVKLTTATGAMLWVDLTTDGAVAVRDVDGSAVASSVDGVVEADTWQLLEIKAQKSSSSRVRVRVATRIVIEETGVDTLGASPGALINVSFGGSLGGVLWSDIIVMDGSGQACNDELGPHARSVLLYPIGETGASADDDWTTSSSPQVAALTDKIPGAHDADCTYLEASSYDIRAVFLHSRLAREHHSVQVVTAIYGAEGTDPAIVPLIASGLIESEGSQLAALGATGTGYRYARYRLAKDPATNQLWTAEAVSKLRVGVLSQAPV